MSCNIVFIPIMKDMPPTLDHSPPSIHNLMATQANNPVTTNNNHLPSLDQTINMLMLDPNDTGTHRVEINTSISDLLSPYSSPATLPMATPMPLPGSLPALSPTSSPPSSPRAPSHIEHTETLKPVGKSLYRLKQAPLLWNHTINLHLQLSSFNPTDGNPCIYTQQKGGKLAIISIYVDNCLIITKSNDIPTIKEVLLNKFTMKDLGATTSILGVKINYNHDTRHMELCQHGHINKLLQSFNMNNCNPTTTPMEHRLALTTNNRTINNHIPYQQIIGKLLYIAIVSQPDITFAVGYLSQFISCYNNTHWTATKRILHYLKGTHNLAINYNHPLAPSTTNFIPLGFCNTNWGANLINRKSMTGYFFLLTRGPIMWTSKAQTTIALSSTKAKYNSISKATKQAIYIHKFFPSLSIKQSIPITIHNNNQSTITITNQHQTTFHSRIKHYNIKLHHVCNTMVKGLIVLKHKPTATMPTDMLTKALLQVKHNKLLHLIQFKI
jgi:hypothetical protein